MTRRDVLATTDLPCRARTTDPPTPPARPPAFVDCAKIQPTFFHLWVEQVDQGSSGTHVRRVRRVAGEREREVGKRARRTAEVVEQGTRSEAEAEANAALAKLPGSP